ncbi:MAG: histidinol-phosphate transaminase [Gemmatimonadaceae bacterium]
MTPSPTMERYQETAPGCHVDLSDNTNLFGRPPSVARILESASNVDLTRYPSAYSGELKAAIARHVGIDESMVVVGCGSDDVLDSTLRAFGAPDDLLVQLDPSFSMMKVFGGVSGLRVEAIPPGDDLAETIARSTPAITYLCSPNNPTGAVLPLEMMEQIVRESSGIVIIDEAYVEFAGVTSVDLLHKYGNVIITRTMSKAMGLAGCRVGFGIGHPALVSRVEAARGPYKVSTLSERLSIAVLENDAAWVAENVALATATRERFARELEVLGYKPLPSSANFLLVPVANSGQAEADCRAGGIAVRRFESLAGIGDALRVTVGPWPMMERCLDALRAQAS